MPEVQKRPIEQHLDVTAISEAGTSERYQRASSPHTIFTWWARRPFSTAKELISSSLSPAQPAEEMKVLDPFVGGATFPLAGTRLGVKMYGMENNELAYFAANALLDLSRSAGRQLRHLLMLEGRQVLDQLKSETKDLYPARDTDNIICYFWSRSATCDTCGSEMPLQKRPWLSKKSGKQRAIVHQPNFDAKSFDIHIVAPNSSTVAGFSAWNGRNSLKCVFCGEEYDRQQTAELIKRSSSDELSAVAQLDKGKKFLPVTTPEEYVVDSVAERMIKEDCTVLGLQAPGIQIPAWSGITNPTVYGHDTVASLFTDRQLAVVIRLCRILNEHQKVWAEKYDNRQSKAIAAFLSGLIDQLADWNSRLCMWISQNEQVGRGLSGPGMPMLWDFVEIDPLLRGPANLYGKLERIAAGVDQIPVSPSQEAKITHGDARSMAYPDAFFDAVVTDPPYYDNLYYSILADCIYSFKRMALIESFPEIFSEPGTDSTRELTAAPRRQGSTSEAWSYFSTGMAQVLRESRRVVKPDGVITLCYAHSSISGWSALIAAYVRAGLKISQLWPMTIERTHRPRSMKAAAINTSLVLVARPYETASAMGLVQASPDVDALIKSALDRSSAADWPEDVAATLAFVSAVEARLSEFAEEMLSSQDAVNSACREIADRIYERIPGFTFSSR